MHFHLPKPLHGWREFVGEVGIIVIGVLIALIGESTFEEWSWHRKIDAATHAMDAEIRTALIDTLEVDRMAKCSDTQLDFLQAKLVAKDWSVVAKPPVNWALYHRHFYGEDAYTSAIASQVAEHLSQKQLQRYAAAYTEIRKIRQHQEDGWSTDSTFALLTIPNLPKTDAIQLEELRGLAKLRDSITAIRSQGTSLRNDVATDFGVRVTPSDLSQASHGRTIIADCEASAVAVRKLEAR